MQSGPPQIADRVAMLRACTDLPIAAGFGISTPDHVAATVAVADAAIVGSAIVAAMGGRAVSQTVEGRERYDILVRYARGFRDDIQSLKRTLVTTADGAQIPISQVADIEFTTGPPSSK
mgnify:CR=1 FL=1